MMLRGETAGDGIYEADFLILEGTDIKNKKVIGHFTDQYGNMESVNATGTITIGTPPEITQVGVTPTTSDNTAIVKWITDENATSQVEFGIDKSYGTVVNVPGLVKNHEVLLRSRTRYNLSLPRSFYGFSGLSDGFWRQDLPRRTLHHRRCCSYPGDPKQLSSGPPTPRKTCLVILSIEAPHPALDFQKSTVFLPPTGFSGSRIE